MELKTLAGYGEIPKNSYVTPFLNNSGCIVLVVNSGTSTKLAFKDAIDFERSSGFRILAQPKMYVEFTRWLMDTVVRQMVCDDPSSSQHTLNSIAMRYDIPGIASCGVPGRHRHDLA